MKKLFYIFMLMAAATLSFTACEDVPTPYDYPEAKEDTTKVDVDTEQVVPTGDGTAASPYNVARVLELYAGELPASDVYVAGIVSQIDEIDTGTYGNATYHISDDGTTNNQYEIYRGYALNGNKFATGNEIKLGDKVVVKGTLVLYYSTKEMKQGSQIVSINSAGGEDKPADTPAASEGVSINGTTVTLTQGGVSASASSVSVDLSTLGFKNADDVTTITLSDGSTIEFSGNGQRNAPKYYDGTKGVRVYANNTITFHGKQKIASVIMECDAYNGVDYVGNNTATVTFSGNDALYNNVFEGTTGGGVQLRVKKIKVTYAL